MLKFWRLTPCPKDHELESSRKGIAPQPLSKIKQPNLQLKDCGFSESKRIVTINSHKSGNSPNPYFFSIPVFSETFFGLRRRGCCLSACSGKETLSWTFQRMVRVSCISTRRGNGTEGRTCVCSLQNRTKNLRSCPRESLEVYLPQDTKCLLFLKFV